MRNFLYLPSMWAVFIFLMLGMALPVAGAEVQRMSTDELNSRLGEAGLVVLDVRDSWDWGKADKKIVGAVRVEPGTASQWAGDYPAVKTIVLYCA
jgi:rhodanese-related sulfurtransferase